MPRRRKSVKAKSAPKRLAVKHHNVKQSVNIIIPPLGYGKGIPLKERTSNNMLFGGQQRLYSQKAIYGNGQGRYIQALPNHASISMEQPVRRFTVGYIAPPKENNVVVEDQKQPSYESNYSKIPNPNPINSSGIQTTQQISSQSTRPFEMNRRPSDYLFQAVKSNSAVASSSQLPNLGQSMSSFMTPVQSSPSVRLMNQGSSSQNYTAGSSANLGSFFEQGIRDGSLEEKEINPELLRRDVSNAVVNSRIYQTSLQRYGFVPQQERPLTQSTANRFAFSPDYLSPEEKSNRGVGRPRNNQQIERTDINKKLFE